MILIVVCSTTIWFSIGGIIDLRKMFQRLTTINRDASDDGEIRGKQTTCEQQLETVNQQK